MIIASVLLTLATLTRCSVAQTTTADAPPPWQTGVITEDGTCGSGSPDGDWVCTPTWGACCSKDGICGRSKAYCGDGCQVGFGNCDAPAPPATPTPGPGSTSPDGSCAGTAGFNCTGSTFGQCCSSGGWCGDSSAHCGTGCQSLFGTCVDTGNVSSDGRCGPLGSDKTCAGSEFGDCCSSSGYCGNSTTHCGAGCVTGFGTCGDAGSVSTDGECGSRNGKTCKDSVFGDCCSPEGFCGGSTSHCGAGCQSTFGDCSAPTNVTTDGRCGSNKKVCTGALFGDCCSAGGFCGTSSDHCGAGCQSAFGTCSAPTNITIDGRCGAGFGNKVCKGSAFGDCCSSGGYCGSAEHCDAGCQASFGTCKSGSGTISTDGQCGSKNGKTCKGSGFGDCCSSSGFCGSTTAHCGTGCQSTFGTCTSGSGNVSVDGQCGSNGKTCKGSAFGDCCSPSGFCGTSTSHCGTGCQSSFGTCTAGSGSISTDGQCGSNGKTCKGSAFGNCCSLNGFCGSTADHCGAGCQSSFGTGCTNGSGTISTDGQCGNNGKTCKGSGLGDCCSSSGLCGSSSTHCGAGCKSSFGTCNSGSGSITTDGVCGTKNSKTCVGSAFGACCSSGGSCGNTANHCGQGCQKNFSGSCITKNIPSVDGTCGSSKGGWTCAGGSFNNQCCSSGGFCGTTSAHCGSGCQKSYGRCN